MTLRWSLLAYLRHFSRPHTSYILVGVPWYRIALKTDLYAIITNVLMLLTIATVISCWRSLWQRQDLVREKERENIQSCTSTLFWRVVTTMNLSLSRAITTVMIPYFTILSVMVICTTNPQSSDTPWLSSAKLSLLTSTQHVDPFYFISIRKWRISAVLSKDTTEGFAKIYIYFVVWSPVTQSPLITSHNVKELRLCL